MKRNFTNILLASAIILFFNLNVFAQSNIDFEDSGVGADWTWEVYENNPDDPALFTIVDNPSKSGVNTTDKSAKYVINDVAQPWALALSEDIGAFTLDENNSLIKLFVYKEVISPVGLKFEGAGGVVEIKIENTVINEWEEISFNFSAHIGKSFNKIVLIPDFPDARTSGSVNYIDEITFGAGEIIVLAEPTELAPAPAYAPESVISVFSTNYDNISGANYNPNWSQATVHTVFPLQGSEVLKYEFLNYQGIEFPTQDLSDYNSVNFDVWSDDATLLKLFVISDGPKESSVDCTPITKGDWTSFSFPLSSFPNIDLDKVFQFKIEGPGSPTIYIDNLFFAKDNGVGIQSQEAENKVNAYVNRNNQTIIVEGLVETVQVYSVLGQKMIETSSQDKSTIINIESLPSGSYVVVAETVNGGRYVTKIMK